MSTSLLRHAFGISYHKHLAYNLGMSLNMVKNIGKAYLKKYISKPDLSNVRRIAIDEFAAAKVHVYMTVVMDLDTTRVLYVGEGRDQQSLKKFWKRIRKKKVSIEAVAMDMWPAYISSVLDNCPDADIVFDHFYIVKMLNAILDEIKRDLYRDETYDNKHDLLEKTLKKTILAGVRFFHYLLHLLSFPSLAAISITVSWAMHRFPFSSPVHPFLKIRNTFPAHQDILFFRPAVKNNL